MSDYELVSVLVIAAEKREKGARRAGHRGRTMDMPKLSDRDKLAELVERQKKKVGDEIAETRQRVRARYAEIVVGLAVEDLSEREFRDLLTVALKVGGASALAALKSLPAPR